MEESGPRALHPGELEAFVSTATPSKIEKLGSAAWIEWHQRLQSLHQQAVLESASGVEEITRDTIVSHGKVPLLIHEALCISIWRRNIYLRILELEPTIESTFIIYAVLYHENVAVGLLEIICCDEEACQSLSDLLIDLIDYCIETIINLITLVKSGYLEPKVSKFLDEDNCEELKRQQKDLEYDLGMRSLKIISCLSNFVNKIHVSAVSRLYETHDTPLLITELIQLEPWLRYDRQENVQHFIGGYWKTVTDEDVHKMCHHEVLTWLSLWHHLLNPELNRYYEINNFRKTQFCKLLYKITDEQMDQIPVLVDLKRFLGQMSVADISTAPYAKKHLAFIEIIPQIRPAILRRISKKEDKIAKHQLEKYIKIKNDDLINMAKKLSVSYTSEILEHMDLGGPKCATCGDSACKKCSRCKAEWYCGRECQVKRWHKHKELCDKLVLDTQ